MSRQKPTYEELEALLAPLEETLEAIRSGEIDALIGYTNPLIVRAKAAEEALSETRETLETVVETAPVLIVMTDSEGRIVLFNRACEKLTGYSEQEVVGKTVADLFLPPEQVAAAEQRLIDPADAALSEPHKIPWRTLSGEERLIEWRRTACPSPRGGGHLSLRVGVDVTERERAEVALTVERDKAQQYLDIAGVIIVVSNSDGKIALINRKGCELLGLKEEEIVGKDWLSNFIPEGIRDELSSAFRSLISGDTETMAYNESPVLTAAGEERLIAWRNSVLRDEDGNIIATLSSGEDITDRKLAENELRRHRDLLEKKTEELTQVIHDLRNFNDQISNDLRAPLWRINTVWRRRWLII